MRRLRVGVLTHRDLVPPDSLEGLEDREIQKWKTEYDVVTTLEKLGHEVRPLGLQSQGQAGQEQQEAQQPREPSAGRARSGFPPGGIRRPHLPRVGFHCHQPGPRLLHG